MSSSSSSSSSSPFAAVVRRGVVAALVSLAGCGDRDDVLARRAHRVSPLAAQLVADTSLDARVARCEHGSDYRTIVERRLLRAVGAHAPAWVLVVIPSFSEEYALVVTGDTVIAVAHARSLWDAAHEYAAGGPGVLDTATGILPMPTHAQIEAVPVAVRVVRTVLPREAGARLDDAMRAFVADPTADPIGLDGTTYAVRLADGTCRSAWSPAPDRAARSLTALADSLVHALTGARMAERPGPA